MTRSVLYKQFVVFIQTHALFSRGERILLAVSGGVDSIVLLDLFIHMQKEWNLILSVAHINHGLRGRKSDMEETTVRRLACKYALPFYSCKTDVKCFAKGHHLSLEEGGREIRFRFLTELLHRLGYTRLALGHQANDQAETILMHLTRGSGLRGLAGIRPRREEVIHPLLFAKRKEIESYARQRKLNYSEDLSNTDRQFLRNRVRWDIVGALEDVIGPHVVSSICRCGDAAGEAELFLQSVSAKVQREITLTKSENQIILDLYKFLSYLKAVQKAVLINCIEEMAGCRGCVRSSEIIRVLRLAERGRSGTRVELQSRVRVYKSKSTLAFVKQESSIPEKMLPIGSGVRLTKDILIKSELLQREGKHIVFNNDPAIEYFDYDMLSYPLQVRPVRPGDWFIPLGMKRKKKLQDFFIDQGLPLYQRHLIPLLITAGNIAWVVGHRMDDRYKVCEQTKRILKIEVQSSRNNRTFRVPLPKI